MAKSERPYPPETYAPQSHEEARTVGEYAFLWLNTRPEPLPSHHYRSLSFRLEPLQSSPGLTASISDERAEKQYGDILQGLEALARPYGCVRQQRTSSPRPPQEWKLAAANDAP